MFQNQCKILIIRDVIIPHYRIPVYEALACYPKFQVTVLHSGVSVIYDNEHYKEKIVEVKSFGSFIYQKGLIQLATAYDVIIAGNNIRQLSSLHLLYKHRNAKFIWWGHEFGRSFKANLIKPVRVILTKAADSFITYNEEGKQELVKWGCNPNSIFVAPNTVYVPNHQINPAIDRNAFLFVGRLQKRKKIHELLMAFHQIKNEIPNHICLHIVGKGEEYEPLKKLAKQLNIHDRVIFHGKITDDNQLKPIFQQSLAYVSPGHVGLGVLHSFAYGIPVITRKEARHAPEFTNIKNDHNGILYNGSIKELAHSLLTLALNPDKSLELGENAYKHYSQERTLDIMVHGFIEAIEYSIVKKKSRE